MFKSNQFLMMCALTVALVVANVHQSFAQALIIDGGVAKATIYLDEAAPASVHLAATDLQKHLQLASNVELPITSDTSKLSGFVIFLGDTEFARKQRIKVKQLPPDGFRILANKDWMIVAGKDYVGPIQTGFNVPFRLHESYNQKYKISTFGETGTLFGVYHFLERYCGIRWYMPGPLGVVVPKSSKIVVPAIDLRKAPAFEHRHAFYGFMERSDEDALWYRRAGYGSPAPIQVSHSFGQFFLKYKDTHPEYFALIDGQRDFTNLSTIIGGGNLNLSNPGLIQQAIDDAIKYFDDNPQQDIFPLVPNDGMLRISDDPESQAQIDTTRGSNGEFSNYLWGFINKVAIGLAKKYPDKMIGCIAYERYVLPPSNIERLSPNVAVVITKARSHTDQASQQKTRELITAWQKKAGTLYAWEYYCNSLFNPNWRGYPMFFTKIVQDDLKFLKGKLKGEYIESESWTPEQYGTAPEKIKINYPGLQHPLLYVTARLLWDPEADVTALMDEYYRLFYGPSEKPMRRFWEKVESNWEEKRWNTNPARVYDQATIVTLLDALKEAQAKAGENSVYRQRIDLIYSELGPAAEVGQRLQKLAKPKLEIPLLPVDAVVDDAASPLSAVSSKLQPFLDRNYNRSSPATNMQMAWDAKNLYVDLRCYESDMGKIRTAASQRDSVSPPIWEDDTVDLFLMPDSVNPERGLHYLINASGVVYDAKLKGLKQAEETAWTSAAKINVVRESGRWVVSLVIPWTELGIDSPQPGRNLKTNFYRTRYVTGELEQSSWAPLLDGRFYDPENFGELILGGEVAPAAPADVATIVPASVQDYGSGAAVHGFYSEGGIPGVGLFLGQPNTLTRNDRAVFRFDLQPWLESMPEIKKVELAFGVNGISGEATERTLKIEHFQQPVIEVGTEAIGRGDVDLVSETSVSRNDIGLNRGTRIDVTGLIRRDLSKGAISVTFRFSDILAEATGNHNGRPVGVTLAGAENSPALIVTSGDVNR